MRKQHQLHTTAMLFRLDGSKHLATRSPKVWLYLDFNFSSTTDSIWSHKQTNKVQGYQRKTHLNQQQTGADWGKNVCGAHIFIYSRQVLTGGNTIVYHARQHILSSAKPSSEPSSSLASIQLPLNLVIHLTAHLSIHYNYSKYPENHETFHILAFNSHHSQSPSHYIEHLQSSHKSGFLQ